MPGFSKKIWIAEDGSVPAFVTVEVLAMTPAGVPDNSLDGSNVLVRKPSSFIDFQVTAATNANPVVLTVPGHTFKNGSIFQPVFFVGMTQPNGKFYKVNNAVAGTSFEIWSLDNPSAGVDGTSWGAFSYTGVQTVHLWRNVSVNTLVHTSNSGKYDLLLDKTERNVIGDCSIDGLPTGDLALLSNYEITPYDPHAAPASAADIASIIPSQLWRGAYLGDLWGMNALNWTISGGILTPSHADGTPIPFARTVGRAAPGTLGAILSLTP